MEDWSKMTVPQLKTACTEHGLEVGGKKAELVQRLETYSEENKDASAAATDNGEDTEQAEEATEQAEETTEQTEETTEQTEETTEQTEEVTEQTEDAQDEATEKAEGGAEKDVEDVIDAIDDIIEEEKNEDDGKEEKAEGEKKEDGGKPEEKKKDTAEKVFVKVPIKKTARFEVMKETNISRLMFGPLTVEDMKNEKMLEILGKAEHWKVNFAEDGEPGIGYAQLKMKTYEEAKELAESITADPFKEGLSAKHLDKDDIDQNAKLGAVLKGETAKLHEAFELRMLYLHNVPESATEETLKDLVPEAKSTIIPRDDERKFKGYAYLEFETIKKMGEFIKTVDNLSLDSNKMTLHQLPNYIPPDDKRTQGGKFGGNFRDNRRFDNPRGGFRGNRGGYNRNQYGDQGDRWGNQGARQYGGNQGAGGAQAVELLAGISQMLKSQQSGGQGYDQGYGGQQRGYDNYGGRDAGYQQDNWGKKRRFDDGGYNQGGGYGGAKRFNTGRRY